MAQGWIKLVALGIVVVLMMTNIMAQQLRLKRVSRLISGVFLSYAIAQCLFTLIFWLNHISFPLNLEAMELLRLQHVQRVLAGLPLYPEPTSDFVALAYNPLSYLLATPFAWVFGPNLFALRLFAIFGVIGTVAILFLATHEVTRSRWWSLMTVGLFVAAYGVMDTYLDMGHADSWLLLTVLLGCYLLNRGRNLLGMLCLIAAFWIKQHGALFVIGGLGFIWMKQGWRRVLAPLGAAIALIPVLYVFMPAAWLGERFHYFTWEVPRYWSEVNKSTISRFVLYVAKSYLVLASLSIAAYVSNRFRIRRMDVWLFMLPFAILTGLMGTLDPGGNNNVFIPMGTWFILLGTLSLWRFKQQFMEVERWGLHLAALGLSFVLFLYNPLSVLASPRAPSAYRDLISYLRSLNGPVYIPWVGQLQDGVRLSPSVHWVPMEDMVRGKSKKPDPQIVRRLMESVIRPKGKAFLLLNAKSLDELPAIRFLKDLYVFEQDTGERFKPLSTLPRRFNIEYPRYLYRYDPQAAQGRTVKPLKRSKPELKKPRKTRERTQRSEAAPLAQA
jgi:Glycosyltransferase family 87